MDIYTTGQVWPWNVDLGIFDELMIVKTLGGENFVERDGEEYKRKAFWTIKQHLKEYGEEIYFYVSSYTWFLCLTSSFNWIGLQKTWSHFESWPEMLLIQAYIHKVNAHDISLLMALSLSYYIRKNGSLHEESRFLSAGT